MAPCLSKGRWALAAACILGLSTMTRAFIPAGPAPSTGLVRLSHRQIAASSFRTFAAADEGASKDVQSNEEDGVIGPKPAPKGFAKKPQDASDAQLTEEELGKLGAKQRMAYWERQKDLEREMDMREIEEYKETQRLIDEGVVGFLPEKISNRMLKRLVPFILLPVVSGLGLFGFFVFLAKKTEIEVSPSAVAFITQVPFVIALLGITYSIMSTSWDPDVEGSFLGVEQFKINVLNLLESLQKTKREERAKEKLKKYESEAKPNRAKRRELNRLLK